jgi:O-antigen/teichoic acid export membrane protein
VKTLARDISWLACGQTAVRGAQVTVALVLIHLLPSAEWNALALAMSVYFVGVTVGSLNLEHSVLGLLPRIDAGHQRIFLTQTRRFLTVAAAIAASFVVLAELSLHFLDGLRAALLLALAVALEIPAVIGSAAFVARGRTKSAGIWDMVSAVGFLAAAFIPAVVHGTATAVLAGLAVYGALRLAAFAVVLRATPANPLAEPIQGLVKSQIAFCAPLGISLALGTLTRAVDKWIVAWHVPDAIGAYAIAAQELPLLAVLPYAGGAAITTRLVRHLANNDASSALHLWRNQAEALCGPVVGLSVAVAVVAPEVFDIFLPSAPAGAATSFAIFALIGVHRVTEYGVVLRAADQNRHIAGAAAIVLSGCCVFGLIGAYLGGIVGVSLGTALAFGIGWVWILDKIATTFRSTVAEVFPWAKWCRAMNAAVTASAAAFVAAEVATPPTHRLLVKVAAFAFVLRVFRGTRAPSLESLTT